MSRAGSSTQGTIPLGRDSAVRSVGQHAGVAGAVPPPESGLRRFPCKQCGAKLEYEPGTQSLKCPYCSTENAINAPQAVVEELDYQQAVESMSSDAPKAVHATVKCVGCAAEMEAPANVTAFPCPFCGMNIVATSSVSATHILPGCLLPFTLKRDDAIGKFRAWLAARWFAPSALKKQGLIDAGFVGTYLPAWTYDARTRTQYSGQRGDAYYVTEYVNINGRRQARQVRKIRWSPASGVVDVAFDDVLVMATRSLPEERLVQLMPWDLKAVVAYDDAYLSGFRAECYSITLPEGFETAKQLMHPVIVSAIRDDIGGDEQRINSMRTAYMGVTYKHVLLPVWLSAYRFNNKVYQFMVNARTGEVTGERPYSVPKIVAFVIMCLLVLGLIVLVASRMR